MPERYVLSEEELMQVSHRALNAGVIYLREKQEETATGSRDYGRGYAYAIVLLEEFRDLLTDGMRGWFEADRSDTAD